MFTYETADQKEVRRFRIAQFNGRMATVKAGESTVTGFVRSVLEQEFEHPAALDHHHHPECTEGRAEDAAAQRARAPLRGRLFLERDPAPPPGGAARQPQSIECSSAARTRSAVLRAPSLRIASARWLSKVRGLISIRNAPCLFE